MYMNVMNVILYIKMYIICIKTALYFLLNIAFYFCFHEKKYFNLNGTIQK